jgi:hypothetical protein
MYRSNLLLVSVKKKEKSGENITENLKEFSIFNPSWMRRRWVY